MSLKPKKHSEIKNLQEKLKHKERQIEIRYQLPKRTLIVCEGIKTEPFYLRGFAKKINGQFKEICKEDRIIVHGTGKNTSGLLRFVDTQIASGEWSSFEEIWLVYDKDDFPYDNFDNTQFSAEARTGRIFHTAWSNECIELWFLLHFQDYISDNGRKHYIKKLNEYFDYSKTREDLYDVIMEKGSLSDAKARAKRQYYSLKGAGISSPSAMVPSTRVFELIETLEQYIHE